MTVRWLGQEKSESLYGGNGFARGTGNRTIKVCLFHETYS
jgi:hypothetical protein